MKRAMLLLLMLVVVAGCGPKTKPTLVKVDAALYTSVKALHDTAVVLGNSKVITPQQELTIQELILPVTILGEQATRALDAWKSGPTPPELQRLVQEMGTLAKKIVEVIPQNAEAKAVLLEKIGLVQQAIAAVLMIMVGGGA
jgi:ABC-type uncharacterized transport system YnjBCD substrate-binding protein